MGHRATFLEHCRRRELAFPVDADGAALWRPSVRAAGWRVSAGRGTVYSTTTVRRRGEEPHDVSLVELDEGYRMLSRVTGIAPEAVRIGLRVHVQWEGDDPPVPVFAPAEEGR